MSTTTNSGGAAGAGRPDGSALYSALVGLTSVVILLQGVWAGMFIREGRGNDDSWVKVRYLSCCSWRPISAA